MAGAWVQSLAGELRSCRPHSMAMKGKKKKERKKNSSKDITWCSISETVISNMQVDKGLAHVHRTPVHQEKENVNMDQDLSRHVTRE